MGLGSRQGKLFLRTAIGNLHLTGLVAGSDDKTPHAVVLRGKRRQHTVIAVVNAARESHAPPQLVGRLEGNHRGQPLYQHASLGIEREVEVVHAGLLRTIVGKPERTGILGDSVVILAFCLGAVKDREDS